MYNYFSTLFRFSRDKGHKSVSWSYLPCVPGTWLQYLVKWSHCTIILNNFLLLFEIKKNQNGKFYTEKSFVPSCCKIHNLIIIICRSCSPRKSQEEDMKICIKTGQNNADILNSNRNSFRKEEAKPGLASAECRCFRWLLMLAMQLFLCFTQKLILMHNVFMSVNILLWSRDKHRFQQCSLKNYESLRNANSLYFVRLSAASLKTVGIFHFNPVWNFISKLVLVYYAFPSTCKNCYEGEPGCITYTSDEMGTSVEAVRTAASRRERVKTGCEVQLHIKNVRNNLLVYVIPEILSRVGVWQYFR